MTMDPGRFAQAQLELRLAVLNRACSAAVARQQQEAAQLDRPDLAAQSITDRQVTVLLERVGRLGPGPPGEPAMTAAHLDAEDRLRAPVSYTHLTLPTN